MNAEFTNALAAVLPAATILPQLRTLDLSMGTLTPSVSCRYSAPGCVCTSRRTRPAVRRDGRVRLRLHERLVAYHDHFGRRRHLVNELSEAVLARERAG